MVVRIVRELPDKKRLSVLIPSGREGALGGGLAEAGLCERRKVQVIGLPDGATKQRESFQRLP